MILNAKRYFLFFLALVLGFGIGNTALATCYQGSDDPYNKGKCYDLEKQQWYEDRCENSDVLIEVYCDDKGTATTSDDECKEKTYNCSVLGGGYYYCSGGECVERKHCSDTDLYKDIYNVGTCTGNGTPGTDSCSGDILTEYYCSPTGECKTFTFDCSSIGANCISRRCVGGPDIFKGYDSDGGIKPNIKGTCIDGYDRTFQNDECVGDDLKEYYYDPDLNRCIYKTIHCSNGCSGGKCLGAAAVIEPSKLQGPNQCCLLNHKFTDVDPACDKGVIVGPANARWCDINGDGEADTIEEETVKWGTCCFLDSLYNVSDWVFVIFFPLAVVVFTIAGGTFMFSGGEPNKVEKARGIVFWGIIGLIIVLFAKIIPAIVKAIIG